MVQCYIRPAQSKTYKTMTPNIQIKPPENIFHVTYTSKGIKMIKLPSIFDSTNVKSSLVTNEGNFVTPPVVYITAFITSKIFHFNNFASNLDVDRFLADPAVLPCSSDKSSSIDNDHGYILTGDLRIIKNYKLRKIICKSPKDREQNAISINQAKQSIFCC